MIEPVSASGSQALRAIAFSAKNKIALRARLV
jgi:hypothetical protein